MCEERTVGTWWRTLILFEGTRDVLKRKENGLNRCAGAFQVDRIAHYHRICEFRSCK